MNTEQKTDQQIDYGRRGVKKQCRKIIDSTIDCMER